MGFKWQAHLCPGCKRVLSKWAECYSMFHCNVCKLTFDWPDGLAALDIDPGADYVLESTPNSITVRHMGEVVRFRCPGEDRRTDYRYTVEIEGRPIQW